MTIIIAVICIIFLFSNAREAGVLVFGGVAGAVYGFLFLSGVTGIVVGFLVGMCFVGKMIGG